jgi:hypothetical protein
MRTERKEKLSKALAMQGVLGQDSKLLWGAIADNLDDIDNEVANSMRNASKSHANLISSVNDPNDTQALSQQLAQMQEQLIQSQNSLNQANLYIQQQDAKLFALEQNAEAQVLKAKMDNETRILVERIKQAGSNDRLIAELSADYRMEQQKYITNVSKSIDTVNQFKPIEGAKPDYTSVGGMKNTSF